MPYESGIALITKTSHSRGHDKKGKTMETAATSQQNQSECAKSTQQNPAATENTGIYKNASAVIVIAIVITVAFAGYKIGQNNTAYTTTCEDAFKQTKEEITKLKSDYDDIKSSMEKLSSIKQCLTTIDELAKLRKTPPPQQPINKK